MFSSSLDIFSFILSDPSEFSLFDKKSAEDESQAIIIAFFCLVNTKGN